MFIEMKSIFFEVFKVPKTKGIALDKFEEIMRRFYLALEYGNWRALTILYLSFRKI